MRSPRGSSDSGPSLEACAGAVIGVTLAYLGAEVMLAGPRHPIHWALALVGAVVGYLGGQAAHWYKAGRPPSRDARRR